MAYQAIICEKGDRIARITLNRPEKLNALSNQLREELADAIIDAGRDDDVNVILLKGAGRAFSAGYDLTPGQRIKTPTIRQDIDFMMSNRVELANTVWNSRKPVIGQIHGYCLAGGTDLALQCDIIVCAEDTQFGFPPVRAQGTPPTHMWTYHVGPQWAKYMLFTGNSIDGTTAERIGLVWKAVPLEDLEEAANGLAETISKVPYGLLAVHKRIVNMAIEMMGRGLVQQLAAEGDGIGHLEPAALEFGQIAADKGLKAALEWRDGKFGDYRGAANR